MGGNGLPPDDTCLEQLSTEELIEIIRTDAGSTGSGNEDFIFAVLEVMEKRRREQLNYRPVEVERAWENFQRYYNTPDGDGLSLYPDKELIPEDPLLNARRQTHWLILKKLAVIAAAAAVLLTGALTAQAMGADLFGTIARWTDEVFHFESSAVESSAEPDWAAALVAQGVDSGLIPTWIPEGFQPGEAVVEDFGFWKQIYQSFCAADGRKFNIKIRIYASSEFVQKNWFEKDSAAMEQYAAAQSDVYLFSNLDENTATCQYGLTEVSVIGDLSFDELKTVFDSILGG